MAKPSNNNPNNEQLEADRKEKFLKAYRKLCRKYGYDWYQPPMTIIKVEFQDDSK